MAVAYQSIGTAGGVTGTSDTDIVLGKPTGTTTGDLLVAVIANSGKTISCSGWTLATPATDFNAVLYKEAGGSEPANYTFAIGATFSYACGVILRFTGHDVSSGLTVGTQAETAAWSTALDLPSVTVSDSGSGMVLCGTKNSATYTGTIASLSRASAVERYETDIDGNSYNPLVATEDDVAAGSISGESITLSAAVNLKYGQIVVIAPAAAAGFAGRSQIIGAGICG